MAATDQVKDAAGDAAGNAKGAADGATGALRSEILGSLGKAAQETLGPAVSQLSQQAAEQVAAYAREQGPKFVREQVLPQVMKSAGVTNPGDLAKAGVGKAGQLMAGAGGITGLAGKLMGKLGGRGGRGKGVATGYGQGRRIMVQQVQYIPVDVKDVYRAWTQSEWPQFMHRVNTLDRQVEEEEARYSIGVKGLFFKKSFTAQVQEQVPFKFIVWSTTQGNIKNTGRVSFHGEGDDLTLMILNLDMAPSGLRERWVRGFRYHKRGIRSDFHRFAAWVQMRTQDELDELEGWLGTIEGSKVTQTHEEYLEEHPEEQERAEKRAQTEQEQDESDEPEDEPEEDEDEEDEGDEDEEDDEPEEDEEEDEPEEEPERPARRRRATPSSRRTRTAASKSRTTSSERQSPTRRSRAARK